MREERKTRNGQKVAEASLGVTSGSGQQGTEGKFLLPTPDKYLMYVVVRPPSGFWGEINTKKTEAWTQIQPWVEKEGQFPGQNSFWA